MGNLFGSDQGFACGSGTTGGGGSTSGGGSTGVSGTVSAIIIVDPSGGGGEPWSGRVQIEGTGGELSSTGGSLVVHISNPEDISSSNNSSSSTSVSGLNAAGGGGSLQVHVSSIGGINGLVVYNGNEQGGGGGSTIVNVNKVGLSSIDPGVNIGVSGYDSADVKVTLDGESLNINNVSLSGAVSGTAPGGTIASSVNVSSIGGVVGLVVYNANEQGGGGATNVNVNKIGVSSVDPGVNIGVSGYDTADVKVTLDGEVVTVTGELLVSQDISDFFNVSDGGGSLTIDGIVGVSGYNSADVKITLDGESVTIANSQQIVGVSSIPPGAKIGVSGYDTPDVKITLDGETIPSYILNSVGVSSIPPGAKIGVSGYDSADIKITLDGEVVPITDNGGSLTVDGIVGVSGYNSADVKVTLDGESILVSNYSLSSALSGTAPGGTIASSVNVSSIGGVVGLVVYNANEQGGGGSTIVNVNKVGLSSVDPGVNIGVSGYDTADVKVTLDGEVVTASVNNPQQVVGVSSLPANGKIGVSGYDTADVKVTLDGEFVTLDPTGDPIQVNLAAIKGVTLPTSALPVYSTSGLQYAYVSLSAAGNIPVVNGTLVAAPGAGYRIIVYNISIILYATGTIQSTAHLTDGNDTGTNRIAFAVGYGTAPTHLVLSNFHGVALTSNTALKYSITESTTNAFSHINVWYRVLPA